MSDREARELLARSPLARLASVDPGGRPILRTVHTVVVDDHVVFHAAPAGEKMSAIGQPAVISVEEVIGRIPSYFSDPERACPATTFYRSVQVHGRLVRLEGVERKARALQALMEKLQPEGGYAPITADDPRYRAAVGGILLAGLRIEVIDGKAKVGQNLRPERRSVLLERLWERGEVGDPRAIEVIRGACPSTPTPAFLAGPPGVTMRCDLLPERGAEAAELLRGQYWLGGSSPEAISEAHRRSCAWVGAEGESGELIASARALADGCRRAMIYDVIVAERLRGRGLGAALMHLLLAHPALRGVDRVGLGTRDAHRFYERFGFAPDAVASERAMVRSGTP